LSELAEIAIVRAISPAPREQRWHKMAEHGGVIHAQIILKFAALHC
jgi:hypothetical protein